MMGNKNNDGQIEREDNGNSSRRPVLRERERFEGVKARFEVGHTSTSDWIDRFGLNTGVKSHFVEYAIGFGGLVLKITKVDHGLGIKTRGGLGAASHPGWRARGVIVELNFFRATGSHEGGMSVLCL